LSVKRCFGNFDPETTWAACRSQYKKCGLRAEGFAWVSLGSHCRILQAGTRDMIQYETGSISSVLLNGNINVVGLGSTCILMLRSCEEGQHRGTGRRGVWVNTATIDDT
jgi:hypothetical protein